VDRKLQSALDQKARIIASRGVSTRSGASLRALPPSPERLALLLEKSDEFAQLASVYSSPRVSDSLRRSGYYHELLRGKSTKKIWEKVSARLASHETSVNTLTLLYGCEFANEFSVGDARVRRVSAREMDALFPREDVCDSFCPSEDPRRWRESADQWFMQDVRSEQGSLPGGDLERDFYHYFLFQMGYWELFLPIALYSSGFFCLPLILQIEPEWTVSKLRSEWPIVPWFDISEDQTGLEWDKNCLRVDESQHKNLVAFVSKMVGAFPLGDKKDFDRRVNVAAERYVRARLSCGPNIDDDDYEQALLHFIIALEALLMSQEKSEGIIDKLSNRAALIAGRDDDERDCVFRTMKALYNQRSKLMHQGELNRENSTSISDILRLAEIARRVLAVALICGDDPSGSFNKLLGNLGRSDEARAKTLGVLRSVCRMTNAPRLTRPEK
jgi:hypothetical protein